MEFGRSVGSSAGIAFSSEFRIFCPWPPEALSSGDSFGLKKTWQNL